MTQVFRSFMYPETVAFLFRDNIEIKVSVIQQTITFASYPLTAQEEKKVLKHFRDYKIKDFESQQNRSYFILKWINQNLNTYILLRRRYMHFYSHKLSGDGLSIIINNLIADKKVFFEFGKEELKITPTGKEFLENRQLL